MTSPEAGDAHVGGPETTQDVHELDAATSLLPGFDAGYGAGYAHGLAAGRAQLEAELTAAWEQAVADVVAQGAGSAPLRRSELCQRRQEPDQAERARIHEARVWAGWDAAAHPARPQGATRTAPTALEAGALAARRAL